MLCQIHRSVCLPQKSTQIGGDVSVETGDSEAHRRTESVAGNSERLACKLLADPVDGDSDIFFFFYVGDDLQKFFSSQAATNVGLAGVRLENSGEALEHDVSGIMS